MTGTVRTVAGDVDATDLGVTNSHDHLFFRSPRLPGLELDDLALAVAEATAFRTAGGRAVVQWTPRGLGRHVADLPLVGERSGLHVVSSTGRHRAEHYRPEHAVDSAEALAAAFVADIQREEAPCGLIKVATGYHHLDHWERTSLDAAASAHRTTGAPVGVHLELGTAGDLVVETLLRRGIAPESIVLGHVGRNPEPHHLLALAGAGTFLCFDGPSRANHRTDWRTPRCMELLVERGHIGQLLIGGDTTTATARSVVAGPGMPALLTRFGRSLGNRIGTEALHAVLVDNPARAFAIRPTD
jgi:phosphotriesterase-related protein